MATKLRGRASSAILLTAQELRIAVAVGTGAANKAVARELAISIKTVEFHLANIYRKLGIQTRAELAHLVGSGALAEPASFAPELPRHPATLFGRDDLLVTVAAAIRSGPLVTLIGSGGVGKTSLALAAATAAAGQFHDGVWPVSMASVDDGRDLGHAAAIALGLSIQTAASSPSDIAGALGRQQRLLILDGCEHVLDSAAALARAVVDGCRDVVTLVTSRERLHIADERVVAVAPVSVESDGGTSPAAQLFIERAQLVYDGFDPIGDELEAVEEVCRRVDGLPLAIELAAARILEFDVKAILARLDEGFAVLSRRRAGGGHDHSMAATIEWSYGLLSEKEKASFDSLAVFPGGFDTSAVFALTEGRAAREVEDCLASLVEKSMVVMVGDDGERRYRLLDSLRDFGLQRLRERGEEHELRCRHLDHFAAVLQQLDQRLRGPDELAAHRAILADWHHFRAAVDTACDNDDAAAACALIRGALWWARTRMRAEVGEWADRVRRLPSAEEFPQRIVASAASAYFAFCRRDTAAATRLIAEARAEELRFGELAEPWVPMIELFVSPDPIRIAGETQRRGRQQHSRFWETVGMTQEAAVRANHLSFTRLPPEQRDEWLARINAAMEMAEGLGNPHLIAYGERNLAGALMTTEPKRALQLLESALATAEPLGVETLVGQIRASIAVIHAGRGRSLDAIRVMATGLKSHVRTGAYSELVVDLTVCTRPLFDLGEEPLLERLLCAIGASHLIVDGAVEPAALGADLWVWLAGRHNEVLTDSSLNEQVSVAREVIDVARSS
jgi:predicted ATPase/DNA-binding CsgD family transcriptional regulator